ncbi:MAG: cell division protein FtsA [Gammaproteobacteria bacterium]|jgi:cell division protein FtsA|nr:cell division protein FtsA [Gammaproteobacteria bacterium]MBT4462740.1 cell division protein FtsA [Gammaproteobacteria bacterium]MBT5117295.1 cell division protein FtsA [Gammaproteobacteria bacterium]MBT5761867.1 cell division protein FtsA [Gammaproteobacteria bacterium]MBT6331517.1 cell division protein FtsA [Gammaproteobacteria bacterium]
MSTNTIKDEFIVALDIGTTKVLCLVADYDEDGELRLVGVGQESCSGLNKGVISEIDATVKSIRKAKDQARTMTNCKFTKVITGIAGNHIQSYNGNAAINVLNEEVTQEDKDKVIASASDISIPPDQEILHRIPQYFTIDGQMGIKEPIGMAGKRLEANVHVITCSTTAKKNLTKCIENSFLEVDEFVLQPVASSYSVLTDEEKSLGVCLVDIGGGTTDIAIFTDGDIKHTAVIPQAGQLVTNDIRIGLRTSLEAAEDIKKKYGSLINEPNDAQINISVPSISDKPDSEISKPSLTHIVTCRIDEIFHQIEKEINDSGWASKIRAGIVFTGGGCKLNGLDTYAENKLLMPTRIGSPKDIIGIQNLSGQTRYSTAVGLLLYKDEKLSDMPHRQKSDNPVIKYIDTIWKKFSIYFQREL